MGCWNKTCGLSNLHITAGTPTYVFVLEKNEHYDHCYSTGLFKPLLLSFEADYDDYGGGENCSGVALPFVMDGLKHNLIEMELGENQYHDIAVKKDKFDDKLFFEAVHEDRMNIKNYKGGATPVYFTMFRKDIVDDILENRVLEHYVGDGKGTFAKWGTEPNYIKYKFSDIVASVRPLLDRMIADSEGQSEYMKAVIMDRIHKYRDDFLAAMYLSGDGFRYSRVVDIRDVASAAISDGSLKAILKAEALMIEYIKGVFIDGFMHDARKTWIPGGHEGSQGYSGGALRQLANATIKVLDKEKAEWLANNECEEDEYVEE